MSETTSNQISPHTPEKDFLWLHIRSLPYFRALMRSVEARFYRDIDLPGPVLDLGCGDGHFASLTFDHLLDIGLDPWSGPIREAAHWGAYRHLVQAKGSHIPFPKEYFSSAISNSVLEHIPSLDEVIREVWRVLKPGATFAFCCPNQNFLDSLSIGRFLDRAHLRPAGNLYRRLFNRISRHYHSDPPEVWLERLERNGFQVERWWHYFSPKALAVAEWGHYFGLPYLIHRKLTGKWVPEHTASSRILRWIYQRLQPYYDAPAVCEDGVCTFYIARRKR